MERQVYQPIATIQPPQYADLRPAKIALTVE
jgi:hypothetical protein